MGGETHENRVNLSFLKTIYSFIYYEPQKISKYSLNGDLKGQKSIKRRLLRYFKSKSIM